MAPDCIVIGFNEPPFAQYESLIRQYGGNSEAYRDLKFSFVEIDGRKLTYVDLLNEVLGGRLRSCDIPNLAAVYLAHYLNERGASAEYINLFQQEKDRLAARLAEGPICVAITTTLYVINFPVLEMVRFIREHNPRVPIVVGGPLISNHARQAADERVLPLLRGASEERRNARAASPSLAAALSDIGADIYVVEGQGEATLLEIVNCLKTGRSLDDVPNVLYFDEGVLVRTSARPEANDLDACAIDWRKFRHRSLGRTIQTRTARSCAFSCAFCNYPGRAGRLALSSIETIQRELDSIRDLGDVKNVVFIDDTFNVPLARFKDICRMMIREQYAFDWFSYFRCSNSDDEAIDLMARSGCKGVFLGIESGAPAILRNMNKAATVDKYAEGIRQLKARNILTFASFIVGFPGETEATVEETARFIDENAPDYYRAQPWYCEPGTPIERRRQEYAIEGEGFVWRHATMDSLTAADHIERLFLTTRRSEWLPQWSFDFWIIPYLLGEGIDVQHFREFMTLANGLLALDIASVGAAEKAQRQSALLRELAGWAVSVHGDSAGAKEQVSV